MLDTMTPRERWLATLALQPVDRLVFWPKLNGSYPPAQNAPFRDMGVDEIHRWIGSDEHTGIAPGVRENRTTTSCEVTKTASTQTTTYRTPSGETTRTCQWDPTSQSWHPTAFPCKTLDDVRMMTEFYRDANDELDPVGLETARARKAEIGEAAVTSTGIGESPLMVWVEWLAGIEQAHWLLNDHQGAVEELFDAIHASLLRRTEIICDHSPADLLYMIENTSTTLISPDQYRRYCAHHVGEYAAIAHARGRHMVLHMCGHLKALLPDLAPIPARAFEAFTSPTLGNTSLLDGRSACPDKCLIGGTNAMLWTRPATEIIAQIKHDLDELPHHRGVAITSAGVMPPVCAPETIRDVCEWVKSYAVRN